MKKNKQPTRKSNHSINWKQVKVGRIISSARGGCNLTAKEFVKRIKTNPGFYDEDVILARDVLIDQCRKGDYTEAKCARCVLERAGYDKRIIPQEAYDQNGRVYDPLLKIYHQNPIAFIRQIEFIKEEISPFFEVGLKQLEETERSLKKAFKLIVERDMTQEEMGKARKILKKDSRSITELALFLLACWSGCSYYTLRNLYDKVSKERKEIEDLSLEEMLYREMRAGVRLTRLGFFIFLPILDTKKRLQNRGKKVACNLLKI